MADRIVAELRGQIPEGKRAEVIKQVEMLLSLGVSPVALQITLQLPSSHKMAQALLQLI